jgi:hypothetical protein
VKVEDRHMTPQNRRKLANRVAKAAVEVLAAKKYVRPIDVLIGIGWLDRGALDRWRQGRVDYLERVVQANLSRISAAMELLRSWASARGLAPRETAYVFRRRSNRMTLRFSKSGHPTIEKLYRTHCVLPALSERKGALPSAGREPSAGTVAPHRRHETATAVAATEFSESPW